MPIVGLLVIVKNVGKPPSIHQQVTGWIDKLWYFHAADYSAIQRDELLIYETTRVNLKLIKVSEISQVKKKRMEERTV